MNTATQDQARTKLRRSAYVVMICVAVGMMLGRILAVDAVDQRAIEQVRVRQGLDRKRAELRQRQEAGELTGERVRAAMEKEEERLRQRIQLARPFLSANDRSRWLMMRALVEPEMRVPGAPYSIDHLMEAPAWDAWGTIDMIQRKPSGHFYSSKPPLLPTIMAGSYWLIYQVTGLTLGSHPFVVGRILLILWNVLPMAVYLVVIAALIERFGRTDFTRVFMMGAATFGTFLTAFATVLNNHLPAAVCVAIALYALVRIWFDGNRRLRMFAVAGFFAALAAASDLPAAAFTALVSVTVLAIAPKPTLLAYVPAAAIVTAGFFGTNWIAVQSLKPAYMHRSETDAEKNWYDYEFHIRGEYEQRDGQKQRRIRESHWRNPVGIDRGESSSAVYAFHVLVGHHGMFSLTPIWLMSLAGAVIWLAGRDTGRLRWLALLIALATLACLTFYLTRGAVYRNYGGMTSGLRWVFWLAPLWLVLALPAADRMARNPWTRGLALVLLILSTLSVSYPTWNPWTHPWLMDWVDWMGWRG